MLSTEVPQVWVAHAKVTSDDNAVEVHELTDHLRAVATLAGRFAARFGNGDWAFLAGLWHDLGKFQPAFQNYIRHATGLDKADAHVEQVKGRVNHSSPGAAYACKQLGDCGRILAYLIAGHHAGLPDWNGGPSALLPRLQDVQAGLSATLGTGISMDIRQPPPPRSKPPGGAPHLWMRMLYSCLVDADFLDTETFMDPVKAEQRQAAYPSVDALLGTFDRQMESMAERVPDTPVNRLRADVLRQCRERAMATPGLFSLTVPTGGGKTLSSLAFALEHAVRYGKRRVVYAIPYTSIIEQTADIYRGIFAEAVVEHHSNLDPQREDAKSRLAAENWDAPIIVTTNVQLFESLYAARSSRCRKLHNLVDSVIVLDEAQLLPPEYLGPILEVLQDLTAHYGVTAVLSTATQPALNRREGFGWRFQGLENVREIIANPDSLCSSLQRVRVNPPDDWDAPTDWHHLAEHIREHEQALVIVNRRSHARELAELLPDAVHLSANLCGAHRSRLIRYIKWRLKKGRPLCVVSTQLVEAGVDVDFPVVFRATAGLDSIAQAAGRCNREGKLASGEVYLFVPPQPSPPGLLRKGEDTARELLRRRSDDRLAHELFQRYFELYYSKLNDLDKAGILDLLRKDERALQIQFRSAAEKFKLIDDQAQQTVIVRYADSPKWLAMLTTQGPERWLMRKLQRYAVNIPRRQFGQCLERGEISEVYPGFYAQNVDGVYHKRFGWLGSPGTLDPNELII